MILARFNAAQNLLAAKLRDLPADVAEVRPDLDVWSAAQIGWHVAATNEWIAGVLIGSTPMAEPAAPGFSETLHAQTLPDKLKTFPAREPPAIVGRDSGWRSCAPAGSRCRRRLPP
jgi:hypothetical protein